MEDYSNKVLVLCVSGFKGVRWWGWGVDFPGLFPHNNLETAMMLSFSIETSLLLSQILVRTVPGLRTYSQHLNTKIKQLSSLSAPWLVTALVSWSGSSDLRWFCFWSLGHVVTCCSVCYCVNIKASRPVDVGITGFKPPHNRQRTHNAHQLRVLCLTVLLCLSELQQFHGVRRFELERSCCFSALLLDEERGRLFVGAKNFLLSLSLDNIAKQEHKVGQKIHQFDIRIRGVKCVMAPVMM